MTLVEKIEQRIASLANGSAHLRTELATFPSGALMVDVFLGDRMFVVSYTPADGFGVDEVDPASDGLGTWWRYSYADLDSAWAKLLDLLAAARQADAARPA